MSLLGMGVSVKFGPEGNTPLKMDITHMAVSGSNLPKSYRVFANSLKLRLACLLHALSMHSEGAGQPVG